jgi:mono/diheme cytochrome c family protein
MALRRACLMMLIVMLGLLAAGCYPDPSPPNLTPIPTLAPPVILTPVGAAAVIPTAAPRQPGQGNAQDGQALFAANCAACHGAEAQGGVGPALKNNQFIKTAGNDKIFQTIADGRTGTAMPAWSQAKGGKLTDAQIDNLVAFLHTLQQ